MHVQQREEAGEAHRRSVHVEQPHGELLPPRHIFIPLNLFIINGLCVCLSVCVSVCVSACVCQSEHFSFLGVNNQSNLSDMRCRTTFYTALGRLLMVDLGNCTFLSPVKFTVKPAACCVDSLCVCVCLCVSVCRRGRGPVRTVHVAFDGCV